ncbi:MAG: S-layer homology domain-containing protein [Cyanobacteria bacterium P01_E01_bin.6]
MVLGITVGNKRSFFWMAIALAWVIAPSCANGNLGQSLQESIAADPRLADGALQRDDSAAGLCRDDVAEQLPESFPIELCYPNAELLDVSRASQADDVMTTQWQVNASIEDVRTYYRDYLDADFWDITDSIEEGSDQELDAVKNSDRIIIRLQDKSANDPVTSDSGTSDSGTSDSGTSDPEDTDDELSSQSESDVQTEFTVAYQSDALSANQDTNASASGDGDILTPEDARLFSQIDPNRTDAEPDTTTSENTRPQTQRTNQGASFTDLEQAPEELRSYVEDLAALGILTPPDGASSGRVEFKPNASVTRQEYAQWLLAANNLFYGDRPSRKIRLATSSTAPAFQDVSPSTTGYDAIQGLADAGLIPSALSGNTAVNFRPTASLTREDLIQWKVPLDRRGNLPSATLNAVEETWGFQDATQVNPAALPAILADYQNGDQANILRAFGYTTLFQPQKAVTRAEAAAVLWHFGYQADGISADDLSAN